MRGCIVKRGPKSWAVKVYLGRDPQTGKDRQKWFSHTRRVDAETHLATLLNQLHGGGTIVVNTKTLLADHLAAWLRGHQPNVAPATYASYRDTIKNHLAPTLGHFPLVRLSAQAIRDYIAEKLATKLSSTTVRLHIVLLHEVLEQAMRDGLLVKNPCDLVQAPRRQRKEMHVLDEEGARLFLGEAKRSSRYYGLYLFATLVGLRQGELLGLRWKDVDFTLGVASITQKFYRLGRQQLFSAPKTEKSRRTVALPTVVVEELRRLREHQQALRQQLGGAYDDHGLVFAQPNGRPLNTCSIVRHDMRHVLTRAGLPRIRFHDLRHTAATLHLQNGTHPKVVQEMLGHSAIGMTLDVYSHTVPGMQDRAAQALGARLFGGPSESSR